MRLIVAQYYGYEDEIVLIDAEDRSQATIIKLGKDGRIISIEDVAYDEELDDSNAMFFQEVEV